QAIPDALHLGPQPLVDDEEARARLVDDSGERLAAQPRVDAEERQAAVRAAAVEPEQLEMVLEHHGDVTGPPVVDRAEPAAQEVRHPHALVAVAAERPRAIVLAQEDAVGDVGMAGARLDLRAEQQRSIERRGGDGHLGTSLARASVTPS